MADNIVLYGPGGASPVNLGSWLRADPGPDFGARGLLTAVEVENFGEGGAFIYERAGVRRMGFPLTLASGGAGLNLAALESVLRDTARPGGYIDVQPENTPSSEAVRFDIVHGRWEPDYSIYHNRVARRLGNLLLDTQPYGYWPTTILLASAGPTGPFAQLRWSTASLVGDAPGLFELNLVASMGTQLSAGALIDGVAWSLSRATNMPSAFITGGSMMGLATGVSGQQSGSYIGTVFSDTLAPFGVAVRGALASTFWGTWMNVAQWQWQPASGAPMGRYRAFGYVRVTPSQALPWTFSLDEAAPLAANWLPLASANPVATVIPNGNPSYPDTMLTGSGPYQILDLGEHTVPPAGSSFAGATAQAVIRLWARSPTTNLGLPTFANVEIAGVYLLPIDGAVGVMPRGLGQPSYGTNVAGFNHRGLKVDAINRAIFMAEANSNDNAATQYENMIPAVDARSYHIGGPPQGATQFALDVLTFGRRNFVVPGATGAPQHNTQPVIGASVRFMPRFQFLKGL